MTEEVVELFLEATAPNSPRALVKNGNTVSYQWTNMKGQFLVMVVPADLFSRKIKIRYVLHLPGNQRETFRGMEWQTVPEGAFFTNSDGTRKESVTLPAYQDVAQMDRKMRWATVNILKPPR